MIRYFSNVKFGITLDEQMLHTNSPDAMIHHLNVACLPLLSLGVGVCVLIEIVTG